jgi:Na+-driven multidrug efflux pump
VRPLFFVFMAEKEGEDMGTIGTIGLIGNAIATVLSYLVMPIILFSVLLFI